MSLELPFNLDMSTKSNLLFNTVCLLGSPDQFACIGHGLFLNLHMMFTHDGLLN